MLDEIERTTAPEATAELLARVRAGDDLAFADLYVRYFDRVRRYLTIALKNPDDAQEVAQDVFVAVFEALPKLGTLRQPFRAWLFTIVRNQAIDHQRRSSHSSATDPAKVHDRQEGAARAAASVFARSDGPTVQAMVIDLTREQQRVMVLTYVYEFTTAEIADTLGTSAAAVRQMKVRSLRTLGGKLQDKQPSPF